MSFRVLMVCDFSPPRICKRVFWLRSTWQLSRSKYLATVERKLVFPDFPSSCFFNALKKLLLTKFSPALSNSLRFTTYFCMAAFWSPVIMSNMTRSCSLVSMTALVLVLPATAALSRVKYDLTRSSTLSANSLSSESNIFCSTS